MRKLQLLVGHILKATGIRRENVAAFMDQGALELTGRNLGHGVEVCILKYDGVINIERSDYDGLSLLALVSGWLADHDDDRSGLEDPEVNATVNDLATTDVQIAVEFQERIEIVPDDSGPIAFSGRRWRVAPVVVDVAERVEGMSGGVL